MLSKTEVAMICADRVLTIWLALASCKSAADQHLFATAKDNVPASPELLRSGPGESQLMLLSRTAVLKKAILDRSVIPHLGNSPF